MYGLPVAGSILGLLRVRSQKTSYMQLLMAVGNDCSGAMLEGNDTTATALAVTVWLFLGPNMAARRSDTGPPLLPGDF